MIIVTTYVEGNVNLRKCDNEDQLWRYLRKVMEHHLVLEEEDFTEWDEDPKGVIDWLFYQICEDAWYDYNYLDFIPHVVEEERDGKE